MTEMDTATGALTWDVLTIKRPGLSRDVPPGKEELMWVANSATLISGERDAMLVDTFLTIEQSQAGGLGGCERQEAESGLRHSWPR
jgi:hypothetical protein